MYQIWKILQSQGRSMKWLARETGFSATHIYHMKLGTRRASPEFQIKAEKAMQIPMSILFATERVDDAA